MTAYLTRQYRPVPVLLSDGATADEPLPVHVLRELESGVNNAKAYSMAHKLRGVMCFPKWLMSSTTTEERVQHVFAPIKVPDGYKAIRWHIGHERSVGTGGDSITLRLRSVGRLYVGPDTFDATYCEPSTTVASLVVSADAHAISTGTLSIPFSDDTVFLILTAQAAQTGTQALLTTIDLTPRLS